MNQICTPEKLCSHEESQKVAMCARCSNYFCHDCFFDQSIAISHGGQDQIKELNTLVRTRIHELESSRQIISDHIKQIGLQADPVLKRNLQRQRLLERFQIEQFRQAREYFLAMQKLNRDQQQSLVDELQQDRISATETSNQLSMLVELQSQSECLITQLKKDSIQIRGAVGDNDDSFRHFSLT